MRKALVAIESHSEKWLASHEGLEAILPEEVWEDIREEIDQHRLFAERALAALSAGDPS